MLLLDLAKDRFEFEDWDLVGPHKAKPGDEPSDEIVIFTKPMPLTNWAYEGLTISGIKTRATEWYIECTLAGIETLSESVEVDPQRRSGLPVLWGTGFTVSQALAELAESAGVVEVAGNFDLDQGTIRNMLNGLSLMFQRPYTK
jgi:uncharacterized protein (DUF433 family)